MSNNRKKKVVEEIVEVPKVESGEHLMEVLTLKKEKLDLQRELEILQSRFDTISESHTILKIQNQNFESRNTEMGKELIRIKSKWWYKIFN